MCAMTSILNHVNQPPFTFCFQSAFTRLWQNTGQWEDGELSGLLSPISSLLSTVLGMFHSLTSHLLLPESYSMTSTLIPLVLGVGNIFSLLLVPRSSPMLVSSLNPALIYYLVPSPNGRKLFWVCNLFLTSVLPVSSQKVEFRCSLPLNCQCLIRCLGKSGHSLNVFGMHEWINENSTKLATA